MTTLDEIQARVNAATEGPWEAVQETNDYYLDPGDECPGCAVNEPLLRVEEHPAPEQGETLGPYSMHYHEGTLHNVNSSAGAITGNYDYEIGGILATVDTLFIAHAREDVPKLVRAIREVATIMDQLDVDRADGRLVTIAQIQQAVRDTIREALG